MLVKLLRKFTDIAYTKQNICYICWSSSLERGCIIDDTIDRRHGHAFVLFVENAEICIHDQEIFLFDISLIQGSLPCCPKPNGMGYGSWAALMFIANVSNGFEIAFIQTSVVEYYSTLKPIPGVMIWYKNCGLRIYFVNSLQSWVLFFGNCRAI